MNLTQFLFQFFGFLMISNSLFMTAIQAQCVQGDVSIQYSISGSKKPSQRTNDVRMESEPGCRGNSSITTGVQGHIGPSSAEQNRRIRQIQSGSQKDLTGINGLTVQIRSNVEADIDNPVDRFPYK